MNVDLLIIHAGQLLTCASAGGAKSGVPKRGDQMRDVGLIHDGAVAIRDGKFVAVGASADITRDYVAEVVIDAGGRAVLPGLVDCHTHTVYAGNRYDEFEMRTQGKSYMDIMQAGGGIANTMKATRAASEAELRHLTHKRLGEMLALGTTTVEIKTGYGLSNEAELRLMRVILELADALPMTLVPTYLGAHKRGPEFEDNAAYLASLYAASLPEAQAMYAESGSMARGIPLAADIFVEQGAFTVDEMREYFEAAQSHGYQLKAHIDQFNSLGALEIALEMGAVSVDHLEVTGRVDLERLAQSDTVGVMLPAVNFNLGETHFGDARHLIDCGGVLALATDYNPGSSPTISLPLVMAIAARYQKLLPAEALNACTINAAAALGLADRLGSIEVGKQADLLILDTDDYRAMIVEFGRNFVDEVIIRGERVWKTSSWTAKA